ncbi:MAG TPA: Uma2 family endonuclease [Candidatus Acidoferrum sp.]|nr:Uma2 family endonuclease [Candidatus Acidoferrum sp.]
MLQAKVPLITRADYEGMPLGPPYFQVIEGDLITSPSPKFFHQSVALNIARIIGNFLDDHPIGEVMIAPLDVFLSDINIFQPDVLFVSNERLSLIGEQGIEGGPELVVEILSPSTAKYDKGSKKKIYSRTGVQELWLIDPDAKTIQVFDLAADAETPIATHSAKSVFKSALLPGLKIDAKKIFREPVRKPRK